LGEKRKNKCKKKKQKTKKENMWGKLSAFPTPLAKYEKKYYFDIF
jgi:hypothetical protein